MAILNKLKTDQNKYIKGIKLLRNRRHQISFVAVRGFFKGAGSNIFPNPNDRWGYQMLGHEDWVLWIELQVQERGS